MSYVVSSWMFGPQSSTCCEVLAYNRAEEQLLRQNSYFMFCIYNPFLSLYLGCLDFLRVQVFDPMVVHRAAEAGHRFTAAVRVRDGGAFREVIWRCHMMACNRLGVTIWSTKSKRSKLQQSRCFEIVFVCPIEIHPMVPMLRIRLCRQMLYGVKKMLSCGATPLRRWCWRRSSLKSPGTQEKRLQHHEHVIKRSRTWYHDIEVPSPNLPTACFATWPPRLSRWQLGSEASAAVNGGNGASVKRPGGPAWKNPWTSRDEGFLFNLILPTQNESEMSKLVQIVVVTEKTWKNTFWQCARIITCFCTVDMDCFQIKCLQGRERWRYLPTKREGLKRAMWDESHQHYLVTDSSTSNIQQHLQAIAYNSIV